ncbi:MAG: putative rane protein [Actinomycetota bacterium]|nr:putative rane protein [Actinomycetota bacterium]
MSVPGVERREAHPDGGEAGEPWRRLSTRMLLVHPVREVGRYVPALFGLVVAGRATGNEQWWWGPLGIIAVIVYSVLRWTTTRYRITPEQVQLRTGLFRRSTIATPADRVRSVDVTASPLHRLLGLAKVDIGTGSHDPGSGLTLDSLTLAQATGLRAELLHRIRAASADTRGAESAQLRAAPGDGPGAAPGAGLIGGTAAPAGRPDLDTGMAQDTALDQDTELARMDPRWVRFAPFTMSGVIAAAAIFGLGSRALDQVGINAGDVGPIRGGVALVERSPIWLDILIGLVALVALVTLLSVCGYVLSFWGFRLTRHSRGSLHVTRGLLTTRSTSIEERRLRGVELSEPLGLRSVHSARLGGITTGLKGGGGAGGGGALLLPPAPQAVAREVATQILGDPAPLEVQLVAHGPAARRRRFTRALLTVLILIAAVGVAVWFGAPPWLLLPACGSVPVAILLAADRYRSLGHAVAGRFLVTRAGSLARRRDMLECDGVIGWNLSQTFFQRRAGLATLTATTAAGRQQYAVADVPLAVAVSLGNQAVPGLLDDFLVP